MITWSRWQRRYIRRNATLFAYFALIGCGGGNHDPGSSMVGGTVVGLSGSGLVLQVNGGDNLTINSSGAFTFNTALTNGTSYSVTVLTQPTNPTQSCTVGNGTGTAGSASATAVTVSCVTSSYKIGGSVSGLLGSGLVLSNNGGDNRSIAAEGSFTFATKVNSGNMYAIRVATQPTNPAQNCSVSYGSGTFASADISGVKVVCSSIGRFAFFTSQAIPAQSPPQTPGIWAATINPMTGGLTLVAGSPFAAAGADPSWIAADPPTHYVYVTNYDLNNVSAYSVDQVSGVLTQLPSSPYVSDKAPIFIIVDPKDRFVYVIGAGGISGYTKSQNTGALVPIAGLPIAAGVNPTKAVIEPSGHYLYLSNTGGNSISAFSIDAVTGALTAVAGSPFASGIAPGFITTDFTGRFVYASNCWPLAASPQVPCDGAMGHGVTAYAIDMGSGALSLAGGPYAPTSYNHGPFATSPTANFAFFEDEALGAEWTYYIDPNHGTLTFSSLQRYADLGNYSISMVVEPGGRFAYIVDIIVIMNPNDGVHTYIIDGNTGAFSAAPSVPYFYGPNMTSFIVGR